MKKSSIFFVLSMALATVPQFACSDGDNNVNQSQEPGGSQQIGSGVQTRKISSELPRLD